jgi:hypothetical protein
MDPPDSSAYAAQSRWTDPGEHSAAVLQVESEPATLPDIISGLILHPGLARMRGFGVPPHAAADQDLRSMVELLDALIARNGAPLWVKRPPEERLFGICRHYALAAASVFRARGVPARLRAGFATYFTPGWAEDHWVCEYYDGSAWKLLDAELGETTRRQLSIAFPAHDVPRTRFLSAGQAWLQARNGEVDPAKIGYREIGVRGLWFVAGSLLRELAALNMAEMQPWDVWGPTRDLGPDNPVADEWLSRFDALASSLADEPAQLTEAAQLIQRHPWAALGRSVLSYRLEPVEVSLA